MSEAVKHQITDQIIGLVKKELGDETGASAAEYALILAIVGTAIAAALLVLQTSISGAITDAATKIKPAAAG